MATAAHKYKTKHTASTCRGLFDACMDYMEYSMQAFMYARIDVQAHGLLAIGRNTRVYMYKHPK